ncbi:site-specific integrase [Amycolatopsis aidingensis]|uniref:site-specific integrase n=1 Tax=Amycolatopsis aidingensis TaxID=2842453 RepID=UPI001C0E4F27|nr:tyrosine-type recombinase/integrase [Amycolatopsis aidingensis]
MLSGILQLAVRRQALDHNPVRNIEPIEGGNTRPKLTFTATDLSDFLTRLDADPGARRADLPDLVRFLFGTGVRISEALALRWCDLNLTTITVTRDGQAIPPWSVWISAHLVVVTGRGILRRPGQANRTKKSDRILGLPSYLTTVLLARHPADARPDDPVFPSATLGWRHPCNVQRSVRRLRERAGYPTFTTHVGRRTVATVLDHAGQTARQIADQLGHAKVSTTQNDYLGRHLANPLAPALLDHPTAPTPVSLGATAAPAHTVNPY